MLQMACKMITFYYVICIKAVFFCFHFILAHLSTKCLCELLSPLDVRCLSSIIALNDISSETIGPIFL